METTIQGPEWDANEGVPSDTVEWKLQFSTRFPLPSPPSAAHFQVFASVYSKKHQGWEWQSTPGGQQWPTAHRSAKSKLNNAHCPVSCSSCYNFWFPYALGSIFSVFSNIMCITCLGVSRGECSLCSCSVWNECKEITKKKAVEEKIQIARKEKRLGKRLSLNQAQSVFGARELKCFVCTISPTETMWLKSGSHWFSLCTIQAWNGWSWG